MGEWCRCLHLTFDLLGRRHFGFVTSVSGLRFEYLSTSHLFFRLETVPKRSNVGSHVIALGLAQHVAYG